MAQIRPQSEMTDLDAVRRYAVSVITQSQGEALEMRAITLALLGGIMWRGEPGSTTMTQNADGRNAILTTTLGDRRLTFSYDESTETIKMREDTLDGPIIHSFCNRTLLIDFERTFSVLWS
ncbi:hypothetical protein FV232_27785 [Methylobacterium sp. WL30]|uniref:hypothetical protein n=1 Tax=Methylobacterium sp. WL30 TaxID=2603895 RepID=UPI0011CA0F08|nr:hypothetical protein [Methylobacterium sp. WL30]TXN60851.1 hypothetical protein FV232_27785 [Methylobacterium sp. WL30]